MRPSPESVSVNVQMPATMVARLDELRHARQKHSTRSVSRGALLREALERLLAQAAAPAAMPAARVRVRERRRKPGD
jgi:Ribbon-helix-helix protein, copG family